jgi:hypothetical protein
LGVFIHPPKFQALQHQLFFHAKILLPPKRKGRESPGLQ